MFQNATEKLTLIASALIQWMFYKKRLPKDFNPERILVVKLDHIGDVLLSTPVFSNLRKTYPNTKLHALTGTWSRVILEHHPDVNKVLEYNSPAFCRSGQPTSYKNAIRLYKQLSDNKYDLLLDLRSDWRIVMFSLLRLTPKRINRASLQVANRLGFSKFSGTHETTRNLDVLQLSGIPTPIQTTTFSVTDEDKKWGSDFLNTHHIDKDKTLTAIHPGSPIPSKRWHHERFAELADWLITHRETQIIFVGVKDELPIINQIQEIMQHKTTNIAGKTSIPQLAAILKRCNLFIGNDSGPMHLSAAVGTTTIGLFGPGDPMKFGPVGDKCQVIRKKDDCPPCPGTICRYGEEGCMSKIQLDDVIEVLEKTKY